MRKFFTALLLASALALTIAGASMGADDVIRIGVFNCLTGQNAFGGQLELEGTQLAHKLNPEILGRKVELIVDDDDALRRNRPALCERGDRDTGLIHIRIRSHQCDGVLAPGGDGGMGGAAGYGLQR